jgi:hypothetical protein
VVTAFGQVERLNPVADAYTRGGAYATEQYGSDQELVVKQGNVEDYFRKSYLKFDLTGVEGPLVDSAVLRLYAFELSGPMQVTLMEGADQWEETSITWSNSPAAGRETGSFSVYGAARWYEIGITSYLLQELSKDGFLTLVLFDNEAFNQQTRFRSREAVENVPEIEIFTGSGATPLAPSDLSADALDTSTIQLHWVDRSHNELGFIIERKKGEGTFQSIDTTAYDRTVYLDSGLEEGTSYTYRVRAMGYTSPSGYSNEAGATTAAVPEGPPAAPSNLTAIPVSTGKVNLEWSDNSLDETYFFIELREGAGSFRVQDSVETDVTCCQVTGLSPGSAYGFRVYASNLYFDSEPSGVVQVTTGTTGVSYYLNSMSGNDAYPGTSADSAWKSLDRVNTFIFSPGDSLLLACGSGWTGQLKPGGSGTEELPITLGARGTGPRPVIDGGGMEGAGVLYLHNQSYWEIHDLEITNDAPAEGLRRGVEISGAEHGTIRHIHLRNLLVHHIKGTVGNDYEVAKKTGGIFFMVWENDEVPTRFDDILIEDCLIHDCANQGIVTFNQIIGYPGSDAWTSRRITGMVIRNNSLHHITKNAMILRMMDGGLVEHNLCYSTATGTTGNTIFTRSSRNVVCQFNEGYDNQSPDYDGSLYDADLESPGCIFQYSYSHDNAHGLYWQCTVQEDTGIIVRYNISQNDRGRIFYINYPSNGTSIYNNTVFVGEGLSPVILRESGSQGGTRSYSFRNNLIVNMSPTAGYQFTESKFIRERLIEHNLFYGIHPSTEPRDPHKVTGDPRLTDPGSAGNGMESTTGYRITEGSAAIDRGMVIAGNGGRDFWGNPLYNQAPDIGAHEFEGDPTARQPENRNFGPRGLRVFPNPLVDRAQIAFTLNEEAEVTLEILDSLGRKVRTLLHEQLAAGEHHVYWDGAGAGGLILENGLYICNLTINGSVPERILSRGIIIQI